MLKFRQDVVVHLAGPVHCRRVIGGGVSGVWIGEEGEVPPVPERLDQVVLVEVGAKFSLPGFRADGGGRQGEPRAVHVGEATGVVPDGDDQVDVGRDEGGTGPPG